MHGVFLYDSEMYVLENTGDDIARGIFAERKVVMGRWALKGRACCEKF